MKFPKGFGKNYFTFSSILAHSVEMTLQSQTTSVSSYLYHKKDYSVIDLEEALLFASQKPCHCNILYTLKTKLTVLCNIFIPRCSYYTTYFAFRRSGVHPPFILL